MGLLTPLALAFAALGIPIIIFYMLKLRREEKVISSTMLWQQVLRDREANAPWQKLRRNLLLLLQLLLLFLLVLAVARPYSQIARRVQGNLIVLLDASASMQATDMSPTRFEAARERARQIVDGLGPNDTMTLIAVGDTPHVLASLTNDRSVLRQALETARPTSAPADWEAAFILASSSAKQAVHNTIVILSDGGLPAGLPDLPGQVSYLPLGITAENVAIAALAVRDGPQGPQAFVRISNPGTQPATALVEVDVNGALFDARALSIPPGEERGFALDDLPLDTALVEARLPEDALALDNTAWAVRAADQQATVLLATPGNTFLERALDLLPDLRPVTVRVTETLTHTQIAQPATPPDLHIFDGVLPAALPETGNFFFIAPPASTDLFDVRGTLTQTAMVNMAQDNALLRYVEWNEVHIARARAVPPPPWADVLIEAAGGPLLLAGEIGGRRVAILTFDLHHSNLPLQIAFPLLMANLTHWLAPTAAVDVPEQLSPGMPALLRPQMGVSEIAVVTPSGQRHTFAVAGSEPIPFARTQELGVYTVEQARGDEVLRAAFAVNLFSEQESDLTPRDAIDVGQAPVAAETEGTVSRREWWRWPALAALSVLLIEWIVHQQSRLPGSLWERIKQKLRAKRTHQADPFE